MFYSVVIYPLTQIIEFVFSFCNKIFGNIGVSVLGVSFAVSLLTLPLYIVAEHWQQVEREVQKRLKPEVGKIKEVFHGNEQYMILSTYYRQNHYHPIMSLRSAFGLLIQIPFFTAAYTCLSKMSALQGHAFLFIRDMGAPDALFAIGDFNVNVLPIAMTLINCISGAIYTKKLSLRDKIQVFGLALVFVCILYDSPAGLVLYWTMNNLFSLIKNIFYKLKNPVKTLYYIMCGVVSLFILVLLFGRLIAFKRAVLVAAVFSLVYFAPLFVRLCNYLLNTVCAKLVYDFKLRTSIFAASAASLWLLTGLLIPTLLLSSSPMEFCGIDGYASPMFFVRNTLIQSFGLFIVWPSLVFFLYREKIQSLMALLFSAFFVGALINAFVFPGNYGILSNMITFKTVASVDSPLVQIGLNMLVIGGAVFLIIFLFIKFSKLLSYIMLAASLSLACVSVLNVSRINSGYKEYSALIASGGTGTKEIKPLFHLTKTGKNVLMIYLDKAQNRFVKEIFDEQPKLYEEFSGFTLYENTVSFSGWTLLGASPCFGGYEYTPEAKNQRSEVSLVQKQNESLLVLPRIFTEQADDFSATVSDPIWANFNWIPDLRIFKDYPKVSGCLTDAVFLGQWYKEHQAEAKFNVVGNTIKRNLLWYGIFKIVPLALRPAIYNDGKYWDANYSAKDINDFLNGYSALEYLTRLTDFNPSHKNTFTYFVNNTPHDGAILQYPDYRPVAEVTEKSPSRFAANGEYYANAASFHRLGEFFDYLKANGAYDNSRIIIVADHSSVGREDDYNWNEKFDKILPGRFHPVLMVKDFNSKGVLKFDTEFMTNADAPLFALSGIVDNPVNPFTGNLMESSAKNNGALVCTEHLFMPYQNSDPNIFTPSADSWWRVKDNIFDSDNWTQVSQEEKK